MAKIKATVRVKAEEGASARPSQERVRQVASILRLHGLEVFHEGYFGVSVRAEPEQLARTLSLKNLGTGSRVLKLDSCQVEPELKELVDLVEIAGPPKFFLSYTMRNGRPTGIHPPAARQ